MSVRGNDEATRERFAHLGEPQRLLETGVRLGKVGLEVRHICGSVVLRFGRGERVRRRKARWAATSGGSLTVFGVACPLSLAQASSFRLSFANFHSPRR